MISHRKRDSSRLNEIILEQTHQQQQVPPQLDSVIIRNLTYEVGRGKGRKLILNRIGLTVAEGTIYGLLGPSGCGKTTMLRCVAGRIRPRNGSVLVFGFRPGDSQSHVPGRDIGYMPQEISIYEDFTIEETLRFFGKINRMPNEQIELRIEFLLQFLDLPSRQRLVTNLSGGQKRRVSLAAALVHSPPLLILDEPTVGVDPLLRQNIWEHLVTLTNTERISVIITTHYIEEARQAHVVGLMRHGKILAENSPDNLMREHGLSNLEDVFLRLCVSDSSSHDEQLHQQVTGTKVNKTVSKLTIVHNDMRHIEAGLFTRPTITGSLKSSASDHQKPNGLVNPSQRAAVLIHTGTNKIEYTTGIDGYTNEAVEILSSEDEEEEGDLEEVPKLAVVQENSQTNSQESEAEELPVEEYLLLQEALWAARRNSELNFMSLKFNKGYGTSRRTMTSYRKPESSKQSPLSEWWATLMAVTWKNYVRLRRNPPVLVFQFMLPAIQVILFCLCIGGEPFDVPVAIVNDELEPRSSTQFLNGLNSRVIRQIKYDNLSSAIEAVKRGQVWGALHIPEKYSQNLQTRLIMGEEVNSETISNGTIRVYPDLTNLHLAMALETTFREAFLKFAKDSLEDLGYDRSLADLPIQVARPIYGNMKKDSYLEFMAPGVVISISYVMATGLTALAFILERRDGLLERSLVSGVQTNQILLAHAINQVFVMMIQIFLVLACTFFVFEIPSRGPFFWVVLLILLQGCVGMSFGLLVSAICKEENTAVMMVVGTFYTNLILAGIIWPIEAMPHWLRPVSYAQPQTLPTDTLRHILSRGWGITESGVLLGFGVTIGWLCVFLTAAGLIFKYSR